MNRTGDKTNKPKHVVEKLQGDKGFKVRKNPLVEMAKSTDQLERIEAKLDLLLKENGIEL